ncbi:heat shock protein DnaJ-like protein [Candidatus Koribacter versatilis Ellin345]|uniref:Heat shock protein DnaJ-like protein n=1 Tax=Koribacter versatilis (strain Ellin345) TaxID=204669 RepID=Q1IUG4_KORVE|nr:Fe-S protein assembly co-chaperone HscB [Candidatus Koribacter versatilis]ABF39486.1 heat shock protein DnaJ-like protein [Candidatus Koribacter versatilis Ellin345]
MAEAKQNTYSAIPVLNGDSAGRTTVGCWSCGDMRAAHFCNNCGSVQPAVPTDYFSFFGLPKKLNIDLGQLERGFYELSRKLHPDRYAQAASQEQQWSLEKTSQLNDAYRTLKDPIARTEYLLRTEGVNFGEQSKSATEEARTSGKQKQQAIPPDMLEEVFELNMQLEEARMNKKMGEEDADLAKQLEQTRADLVGRYKALDQELKKDWDEWDAVVAEGASDAKRGAVTAKMVDLLNRRTYIRNLVRDVNDVLGY